MEEKLLFASGSWNIADEGKDALKNVAKVLETNTDINVTIEGHTDNVPFKGNGQIRDNWDLSVMRANAVVKILLENGEDLALKIEVFRAENIKKESSL